MIIWGRRAYRKIFGKLKTAVRCEHCHNEGQFLAVETGRWFTFFFIPMFKYGRRWYLLCPVCSHGREYASKEVITKSEKFLAAD